MIKVINESEEKMEVEFAYFHPHVGMRKCSKDQAIKMVENYLNDMKNGSGYDIAGRGFAIYCTQSPDKYDGQMIYGRNDPHEFLDSLKESKITESEEKYQFTLPYADEDDLEYQRKVAKQLGLDFEFVDKKPEYMVFRGSKELLTKYCDTYGQNSRDIEKVEESLEEDTTRGRAIDKICKELNKSLPDGYSAEVNPEHKCVDVYHGNEKHGQVYPTRTGSKTYNSYKYEEITPSNPQKPGETVYRRVPTTRTRYQYSWKSSLGKKVSGVISSTLDKVSEYISEE